MDGWGISSVAAITVISYLIVQTAKIAGMQRKWLPVLSGFSGMLLGIAARYWMPGFPAEDILNAAAVGIVSGLAATGANQVVKQLRKD